MIMNWRTLLYQLEQEGDFDIAIFLLEKITKENPLEVDPYLFLLYRLMDSIVDNEYYWSNVSHDLLKEIKKNYYHKKVFQEYRFLLQKYFDESYAKLSGNSEYLFYASGILMAQYWFCNLQITDEFLDSMQKRAFNMGYNAILAQVWEYRKLAELEPCNQSVLSYAHQLAADAALQEQLRNKGIIAEYVFGADLTWAKAILENCCKSK